MLTYVKRIFKNGWLTVKRYPTATFATLLISFLIALSMLGVFASWTMSDVFITSAKDKLDFSVFFKDSATTDVIHSLQNKIEALPYVSDVRYITKEEALQNFMDQNKSNPVIGKAISTISFNPLVDSLVIRTKDAKDYEKLYDFIQNAKELSYVDTITFAQNKDVIDKLIRATDFFRIALIATIIFFFIVSIAVISNTIELIAYAQRDEIEIMKMIGASNIYIVFPHFLAALFYSLIGTAFALLTFALSVIFVDKNLSSVFPGLAASQYVLPNIAVFIGITLAIQTVSLLFSTFIAAQKYLKDTES